MVLAALPGPARASVGRAVVLVISSENPAVDRARVRSLLDRQLPEHILFPGEGRRHHVAGTVFVHVGRTGRFLAWYRSNAGETTLGDRYVVAGRATDRSVARELRDAIVRWRVHDLKGIDMPEDRFLLGSIAVRRRPGRSSTLRVDPWHPHLSDKNRGRSWNLNRHGAASTSIDDLKPLPSP
ncbi:MAG: hypothetical protein KC416_15035 [Myxococcales bacterium]|nr:hypothetical protein [Myxococcales bacterium]